MTEKDSVGPGANFLVARSGRGDGGPPNPVDDACAPADAGVGRWQVHRLRGTATQLHDRPWPASPAPTVWVLDVAAPALVLGSTQPAVAGTAGLEVARRRSGGGAVLVRPGSPLWVDVLVPRGDPRWDDDVGRAFGWLGRVWLAALEALGVGDARVHEGRLVRTRWSDAVCFAGLGPGEVSVGGRKVVGISQRRTRQATLLQCAALLDWDARAIVDELGLPRGAIDDLADVAAGLPVEAAALERAFLAAVARR